VAQPVVAIVGSGQAGFQVAVSLRELKYEGRVVMVGDEPHAPYRRPPLSKTYLMGEANTEEVSFCSDSHFVQQRIELIAGKRAVSIDRARRVLRLDDDSAIEYDHLVLAIGARNRPLPLAGAELRDLFYLRTLSEADALRARMATAKSAVVIGAGFIGLEFAAVAAKQGLEVTVLEAADRPMARAISKTMSDVFTREHASMGVRLVLNSRVTRLVVDDGRVRGVETSDGQVLPADLVVVGIGVIPNVELATSCDLRVEDGIVVDELLQTSDPHISAIGDVATHVSRHTHGARARLESVQNACDQARCVARRIAGKPAEYDALPWFWTNQGPLKLQIAGLASAGCDEVVRGDPNGMSCSVYLFRNGKLVCVESLNRPADHMLARRLLTNGVAVTPQQAADGTFELKSLLAPAGAPK